MATTYAGRLSVLFLLTVISGVQPVRGEELLFEDKFNDKLSDRWKVNGFKETDYRIRNHGLEVKVQPGKWDSKMPTFNVDIPFEPEQTVIVSVKVTLLDSFTNDGEFAGTHFFDEDGSIFKATKERVDGRIVYTPGEVIFEGKDGEEGDPKKYRTTLIKEDPDAGPLRIIVDHKYAFFQVGPSKNEKFHNHFYCAVRHEPMKRRGFGLVACGAPEGSNHWVRFEDFRVFIR